MARKRGLQSSQSNPSSSAANAPPPAKRTRVEAPETAEPTQPTASTSTLPTLLVPETPDSHPQETLLLPPTKRKHHPGSLRRLLAPARSSIPFPTSKQARTRAKATLSGSKIGGKSKDLKDGVVTEEMWINRGTKGNGLGFGGYLKKGVGAFVERG